MDNYAKRRHSLTDSSLLSKYSSKTSSKSCSSISISSSSRKKKNLQGTKNGYRIFIGSANLGNALPNQKCIRRWLPKQGRVGDLLGETASASSAAVVDGVKSSWKHVDHRGHFEVIALGLQEVIPGSNSLASGGWKGASKDRREDANRQLLGLIHQCIGKDNYALLSNFQRGEMILFVFVHQSLAPLCSIKVTAENTGLANVMANKGGIAAILTVNTTRIAFLSMHLEPHEGIKRYEKRNADIAEILQGTKDPTLAVHHAFILGDLNYRVAFYRHSKDEELSKEEEMSLSQKLIAREDWISMNCYDELSRALREKKCLVGFQTPLCDFPPTFKIERRKGFVYDWKRIPSYTDRILWKSIEETRSIQALIYEPIADFETSDHKPMRGIFFLPKRRPLCANPQRPILNLRLQRLQCKNLRPGKNLLLNDIHTFLKFYCEPSHLMMQPENNKANLRTSTVKSSNCPQWPEKEFHFKFYVYPEQTFVGAYLFVYSMADIKLIGDSKIGTAILDLEYFATNCKDGGHKRISLQKILLRSGKEAGNFSCDLLVWWSKE